MFPTSPSPAQLSSPCHLVPGPLPPQDAPEHPSPGILHPRHPLLHASSHDQGTWGISVPKWDGSRADSLPLLLRRVCRAEPGTALAFSPFPAPPGTVRPLCSPCQGQAAMGPLLVLSAPPTVVILWAGSDTGREGAQPGAPHIPLPLTGLFTWEQDSWMSPFRVPMSCPTPALLPWAGTQVPGDRDKGPSHRGTLQRFPGTSAACPLPGLCWSCPSTAGESQDPHLTLCPMMRDSQRRHTGVLPPPWLT